MFTLPDRNQFQIYWLIGLLALCLTAPGYGQQAQTGQITPDQAAQFIVKSTEQILQQYMLTGQLPFPEQTAKQIEQVLANTRKAQGLIRNKNEKAYIDLLEAWMEHIRGNGAEAIKKANRAYQIAPNQTDVRDSMLFMCIYWEDYAKAQSIMKRMRTGQAAQQAALASIRAHSEMAIPDVAMISESSTGLDPNGIMPGEALDEPNTATPADQAMADMPALPGSQIAPPPAASARRPSGYRSGRDQGGGMLLGPSAGPIAPVNPNIEDWASTPSPATGGDPMMGNTMNMGGDMSQQTDQPVTKVLNFQPGYMLWDKLGQDYQPLQLRAVNGSNFHYETGKGGVLCALIWTLPSGQPAANPNTMNYGMGYDPSAAMYNQAGQPAQQRNPLGEVVVDLNKNLTQFRFLYSLYVLHAPSVQFVSVCLNNPGAISDAAILEVSLKDSCPWAFCAKDQFNLSQLGTLPQASPILMIVGSNDKIRYMGPVGGLLPMAIISQEYKKIQGSALGAAGAKAAGGQGGGVWGILGQAMSGNSSPAPTPAVRQPATGIAPVTPAQPVPPVAAQPAVTPTPAKPQQQDEYVYQTSVAQARQRLQVAQIQKRTKSFKSALDACDEIIAQWPGSQEANEAKELIREILFTRPVYKQGRAEAGKWMPEGN